MTPRLKGILLMLLAVFAFTALDSCAKFVMRDLPAPVAVFFRYLIALGLAVIAMSRSRHERLFATAHPFIQASRGFMLLGSTAFNFIAMNYLQLAQTSAISFTIPLWVCVLSGPLLGEVVGLRRWLAVMAGLVGVLIITRPGTMAFHPAMLLSVISTACAALYNIATRKVGGSDHAETSLFYATLVGCLAGAVPLAWHWQMPEGAQWLLLGGMGLAGAIGHFLLIQAHRLAPASLLAPFGYTQMIWMIAAGYLLFRDVPDSWTIIGAAIVAASSLVLAASERRAG